MAGYNLNVEYDALKRTMQKVRRSEGFKDGMQDGARYFAAQLAKYPPERHGPAIWSNDPVKRVRQIRGFFYYLRKGLIEVPFRRTRALANAWRVIVRGMTWEARNDQPYASLTQGRKRTRYHALTNWKTPPEVWQRDQHAIKNRIGRGINKMIRRED